MRFTSAAAAATLALVATSASAQNLTSIIQYGESTLSASCQSTINSLGSSNLTSCLNFAGLAPLLTSNGSIVPILDTWMTGICSSAPCSNATLVNATSSILTGCSTDLAANNITNATVATIVRQYPLAREILCLKTSKPFNGTNSSIPITSPPYNSTNGTFCVTSVLTETSAYLGVNITTSYIISAALGANQSVAQTLKMIPPSALCSDCVYAAVDLILEAHPQLSNYTIANYTASSYLNATCPANYTLTFNGTIPSTIYESAINSTFPFNVTSGNLTFSPVNLTRRSWDVTAAKRRWVGQN